jgi:transposase
VFVIGIDPHKGSHSAVVLDQDEQLVGELRVRAGRRQREELVVFASRFEPRCWAIEGATGTGALLAQQLVAAGETVLDVPPTLSARARLLDAGRIDKTDAHDAGSAAVVALRHSKLRTVGLEDHTAVLRLLAKRYHDLVAHRTR